MTKNRRLAIYGIFFLQAFFVSTWLPLWGTMLNGAITAVAVFLAETGS